MIHLHAHGVTPDRTVLGGHFSVGSNPILATIDWVLVEFDGAKLNRRYDPDSGLMVFSPELSGVSEWDEVGLQCNLIWPKEPPG